METATLVSLSALNGDCTPCLPECTQWRLLLYFPFDTSSPIRILTMAAFFQAALSRPILFSNWLSKDYTAVDQEELREYVQARLKVFYEEELDIPLVLFNEVLDHVLRIDRIFKQKQVCMCGHVCGRVCVCMCVCVCVCAQREGTLLIEKLFGKGNWLLQDASLITSMKMVYNRQPY